MDPERQCGASAHGRCPTQLDAPQNRTADFSRAATPVKPSWRVPDDAGRNGRLFQKVGQRHVPRRCGRLGAETSATSRSHGVVAVHAAGRLPGFEDPTAELVQLGWSKQIPLPPWQCAESADSVTRVHNATDPATVMVAPTVQRRGYTCLSDDDLDSLQACHCPDRITSAWPPHNPAQPFMAPAHRAAEPRR